MGAWTNALPKPGTQAMKERLTELVALGEEAAIAWAGCRWRATRRCPISAALPPTVQAEQLRRDDAGLPRMPAENSAYLGRALFTDFLLPVELGGSLLLVATVGAIAIAFRRS